MSSFRTLGFGSFHFLSHEISSNSPTLVYPVKDLLTLLAAEVFFLHELLSLSLSLAKLVYFGQEINLTSDVSKVDSLCS